MPITITITNPWTGSTFRKDVSGLTGRQLDAYAPFMADNLRERLSQEIAPCSPARFLKAWADAVGPVAAGLVILGC